MAVPKIQRTHCSQNYNTFTQQFCN